MSFKFRDVFQADVDKVFAYNTDKEFIIQDKFLASIYKSLQVTLILFWLLENIINDGFKSEELSRGSTVIRTSGSGTILVEKGRDRFWDTYDTSENIYESGSFFIPTKSTIYPNQQRGTCEDENSICKDNTDCIKALNEVCNDQGFCEGPNWCLTDQPIQKLKYDISKAFVVLFKSEIANQLNNQNYETYSTTEIQEFQGTPNVNMYSIADIISMSNPPQNLVKISDSGAVFKITIFWRCDLGQTSCTTNLQVNQLDNLEDGNLGFQTTIVKYKSQGRNAQFREKRVHTGFRFIVETEGYGKVFDSKVIAFQIMTLIIIMKIPAIITDFVVVNLTSKSQEYVKYKFDMQDNLESMGGAQFDEMEQEQGKQMVDTEHQLLTDEDDDDDDDDISD